MNMDKNTVHEDRGPEIAAVMGLFLGLTWIFVSMRTYTRLFINKTFGADDILLVVSQLLFTAFAVLGLLGVHYGTGRHQGFLSNNSIAHALYYWWLCEIFYTVTGVFVRLSIAVFLLRLSARPIDRYIIYGTLPIVILFSAFYFFLTIFQCSPVQSFWAQFVGMKGTCLTSRLVPDSTIAQSIINCAADWVLGFLPIAMLWNVKIERKIKICIAALLSLGISAGITALVRIPFIKTLAVSDDWLWTTTDVAILSTLEIGLGILAAGAAALRPLFRKFGSSRRWSWTSKGRSYFKSGSYGGERTNKRESIQLRPDIEGAEGVVTWVRGHDGAGGTHMQEQGRTEEIEIQQTVDISNSIEGGKSENGSEVELGTSWTERGKTGTEII